MEKENTENIKYKYIPESAYKFFPSNNNKIDYDQNNPFKSVRRIFETIVPNKHFMEFELTELKMFNENEKFKSINLSTANKLRFLQATGYDHNKSFGFMEKYELWLKTNIPVKYNEKHIEILNLGFIYVQGRDHQFRPIIVLNIQNFIKNKDKYTFDEWNSAILYLIEFIIENLLLPGQIENWVVIANFTGCSIFSIPNELKKFVTQLQDNYRCRLAASYIVGMSTFMSWIFNLVLSFLETTTQKKIKIIDINSLSIYINSSQLESEFGGNTKVKEKCFPPEFNLNLEDHGCLNEEESKNIVENYKYDSLIRKGWIIKKDPHFRYDEETLSVD